VNIALMSRVETKANPAAGPAAPVTRRLVMSSPNTVSLSGLSEGEAQEFHRFYLQGMWMFTAIAVVAHVLVFIWRPWFV
jgi:Antenna complex alpha/beta subunit